MTDEETGIRNSAFEWLRQRSLLNGGIFSWREISGGFEYKGRRITLAGATGIWTPAGLSSPISITSVFNGPYEDSFSEKGILNYRYRGTNPDHRDNRGLRTSFRRKIPLIYFLGVMKAKYYALWPVFIIGDFPEKLAVKVDLSPSVSPELDTFLQDRVGDNLETARRYSSTLILQRLHQSVFREQVITAYNNRCTICNLQHKELLDAAHIIPDRHELGNAVVPNGLSMCKIHHASFDRNIIGISPDYEIKVRKDILEEEDGDMLEYGLQKTHGKRIILPEKKINFPDKDRLAMAYERFLSV